MDLLREAQNLRRKRFVILRREALDEHVTERVDHAIREIREPNFYSLADDDGFEQRHDLAFDGFHRRDASCAFGEHDGVYAGEELLQMRLDHLRILRLS